MAKKKALRAEALFNREPIEVEVDGGVVYQKHLTTAQALRAAQASDDDGRRGVMNELVFETTVDETGARVFEESVEVVDRMPFATWMTLTRAIAAQVEADVGEGESEGEGEEGKAQEARPETA